MTDFKAELLKLHKNLNVLRERAAKYGGNTPPELLNWIDDHLSHQTNPKAVKVQVEQTVQTFNQDVIKDPHHFYITRYRGPYLYLVRTMYVTLTPLCRLKYTGQMDAWEFAIYKYSTERYDPDERFFPGSDRVDGTIEGALRAGLEAYV